MLLAASILPLGLLLLLQQKHSSRLVTPVGDSERLTVPTAERTRFARISEYDTMIVYTHRTTVVVFNAAHRATPSEGFTNFAITRRRLSHTAPSTVVVDVAAAACSRYQDV